MATVYYGETICQAVVKSTGNRCKNGAYYNSNSQYLCGVHSKNKARTQLLKNPNKSQLKINKLLDHNQTVSKAQQANKISGITGQIILYKMKMMASVPLIDGYLNVFPNFKHHNRADGLGFPSLSPKAIGPINHGQPGLPIAKNLENFHQGNKVFPSEVDQNGLPLPIFYTTRLDMYLDDVPHRHKTAADGKNVPKYSVWVDNNGVEHHIDYITSRQFYCTYYERATLKNPDFLKLKEMIKDGYNLQICGYDAFVPTKTLEWHYLDPSQPFGHELVLYTMLVTDDYPWAKHRSFIF